MAVPPPQDPYYTLQLGPYGSYGMAPPMGGQVGPPPPAGAPSYNPYPGPPPMAAAHPYEFPAPMSYQPPPGSYAMIPPGSMDQSAIASAPPPQPMEGSDNPELFIAEAVRAFLPYFQRQIKEKNLVEILNIYENEFNKLSERYFTEFPWPEAERIVPLLLYQDEESLEVFQVLYKELYFRHIYAKHKPTLQQRFDSYANYCDLFHVIINAEEPLDIELPNQWLWDIIDEFIYQFQSYIQYRGKLKSRSAEEISMMRENSNVWSVHSVLNVLFSLVKKSNINEQLEAYQAGEDPSTVAGDFGSSSLYKNLGYFSLTGLLRLHCQLGDYYTALQSVNNVQLSKKVLANTRVPASQIALHYYVGFSYLMMRRYKDTIRTFSNIIVFIQRAKQHFQPKSFQHDLVLKQNEQMLNILAMVLTLCPQHVDEVVNSQLKDRCSDKMARLQRGDLKAYEEMFMYSCPKFISSIPPDYESLPENYSKEPTLYQTSVFMAEIEQQLILPVVRSYLKFYTTMPLSKLAAFMELDESTLRQQLLRFKHKTRSLVSTSKGTHHLSGEMQSSSDLDFYMDGEMIHIADTKMARRYGDFFIRQIHKLEEILRK